MDQTLLDQMSVSDLQGELNVRDAKIVEIRAEMREIQAVLQRKDAAEHAARAGDPSLAQKLNL